LAKVFTRDAEKAMAVLQGYEGSYESGNLKAYITNVHALKSALANIGETGLSGVAKDLEQAGRDGNTAFIADGTPAFMKGLRELVDKLKPETDGAGSATEEDLTYLRKTLSTVKDACAGYDIDAADTALKELKQRPWPSPYGELLDTISEHLLHSDFDEAEAVCSSFLHDGREANK
jgi:HPt (histidine-containing phosphotransfer) domain-containing protein